MVDLFDNIYFRFKNKNKWLSKFRYYSLLRFLVRLMANFILPFYFVLTSHKKENALISSTKKEDGRIIISFTSFPARIDKVWIVVETLLRQKFKPDMIILWLSKKQFPSLNSLPRKLLKQQKRGLTIKMISEDLRSHKKYYYAIQEFPNDYIITVDDDVIYNSEILKYLIDLNKIYPNTICCNKAHLIKVKNKSLDAYKNWEIVENIQNPSNKIIPIGVGGVLYPPNSLHPEVSNSIIFKEHCLLADDIWLNIMARFANTKIAKSNYNSFYLPILYYKAVTLNSQNLNLGLNDIQIQAVRNYYITQFGVDPYCDLLKE